MSDDPATDPVTVAGADHWQIVDEGPLALELRRELDLEAAPTHLLYRAGASPLARCLECRTVAFHLGVGRFALVELTGSGHEELPPAPRFVQVPSFDALRESMARHRHR